MKSVLQFVCVVLMLLYVGRLSLAADESVSISWNGKDIANADVKIPADRPSVVAFVRADQDQSKSALTQIASAVADAKNAQVIILLSGPAAAEQAKQMSGELSKQWSVVADADFSASGKMNVHVWPTTLVVKSDGTQVAHLAGMPKSFAAELTAYINFASGKINDAALKQMLASQDVVTDSPTQAASRHLQVAQRFLEQGQSDQAKSELEQGLKISPGNSDLQLTMARVLALQNRPKEAMELLDRISAGSVPAWQVNLIRGRALILQDKWGDAKTVLPEALKLNPDPAEAHYLLGVCYQHDQDLAHAAEQFRLAFEKSPGGAKTAISASR